MGGPGQEFVANGIHYPANPSAKPPTWLGRYRIEVSPSEPAAKTRFLTVLQAALNDTPEMVATRLVETETQDGVELTTSDGNLCRVMFNRDGPIARNIQISKNGHTLVSQQP